MIEVSNDLLNSSYFFYNYFHITHRFKNQLCEIDEKIFETSYFPANSRNLSLQSLKSDHEYSKNRYFLSFRHPNSWRVLIK